MRYLFYCFALAMLTFVVAGFYASAEIRHGNQKFVAECWRRHLLEGFSFDAETLDDDYMKSRDLGTNTPAFAAKVHEYLNRLFFPLVAKLRVTADQTTLIEISEILKQLENEYPLRRGKFTSKGPDLGSDPRDSKSQALINGAVTTGIGHYGFEDFDINRPDVLTVRFNEDYVKRFGTVHLSLTNFITPINSYGEEFSAEMLRTTEILAKMAADHLESVSHDAGIKNRSLLLFETFRGKGALTGSEHYPFEMAPLSATIEGIVTMNQAFSFLLASKMDGYQTGEEALKALIFNNTSELGLMGEMTRRLPFGMLGPSNALGKSIKIPLEPSGSGALRFSDRLKSIFRTYREHSFDLGLRPGICPMAALWMGHPKDSTSGIQLLAESYWKVFEAVHQANLNKANHSR